MPALPVQFKPEGLHLKAAGLIVPLRPSTAVQGFRSHNTNTLVHKIWIIGGYLAKIRAEHPPIRLNDLVTHAAGLPPHTYS